MADDIEEIEARLAAYIDGTLPAEQKAEIETYLSANPSHGKLIAELQSIRAAVRNLPREHAPAEVLDTLQSHLERQSLLEPTAGPIPMPVSRWPQLGAVAAVLLLAGGLGLLIYQVMPGVRRGDSDLALLTASATRPAASDAVTLDELEPSAATTPLKKTANAATRAEGYGDAVASNFGQNAPGPDATGVPQPAQQLRQLALQQGLPSQPAEQRLPAVGASQPLASLGQYFADAAAVPAESMPTLVVRSDDPALTRNLLAASLTRDGVAFDVPTTPPATRFSLATTMPAAPSVGNVVDRLTQRGELTVVEADAVAAGRPMILRGVDADAAEALTDALNRQRPGRQTARLARERPVAKADVAFASTAPAATTQSTRPADADVRPAAPIVRPAATSTTSPAANLMVLIVPVPPVATRPATTTTTAPTP